MEISFQKSPFFMQKSPILSNVDFSEYCSKLSTTLHNPPNIFTVGSHGGLFMGRSWGLKLPENGSSLWGLFGVFCGGS